MYRILEILRNEEGFVSGEQIGKRLNITRAAIWKGIKKLREEGYEIEAVTNKGYRLILHETMYNAREISAGLTTKKMGHPLYFYEETDTTNARIRDLAQRDAALEGTVAIAEYQSAGRGRRGRAWSAPGGSGIWMSFLLRPPIQPEDASVITLLAGLAVGEALQLETGLAPEIKWPNDILFRGKKAVGILTEMECEMQETHFVTVGIGVNVNMQEFPREIQAVATSLYLESGRIFSRKALVQRILLVFEEMYDKYLEAGCSFAPFLAQYRKHCITLGKEVEILGRETFFARAVDITPQGELVVLREDTGQEEVIFSGEVSIRGR